MQHLTPQALNAGPPTDAVIAKRLAQQVSASYQQLKSLPNMVQTIIDRAPGGKVGLMANLDANVRGELVTYLGSVVALLNALKEAGDPVVVAPLLIGDIPV